MKKFITLPINIRMYKKQDEDNGWGCDWHIITDPSVSMDGPEEGRVVMDQDGKVYIFLKSGTNDKAEPYCLESFFWPSEFSSFETMVNEEVHKLNVLKNQERMK